jgi:uncharacterized membrane protein YdjX (TVP38/TMEM64 family)
MFLKAALSLILLLLMFAAINFYELPTLGDIQAHKQAINFFIESHYLISVGLFFMLCVIFINSPLPFAAVMKVLAGYFYGFYVGAAYSIGATLLACLVGFWLSRYAFRRRFEQFFYARLEAVEHEIERNGFYYFLSLRIVMVVPYFLINIIAGLSRLSLRNYLLSTVIGVVPASLIYANGGEQLERISTTAELLSWDIVVALAMMASASLIPAWWQRKAQRSS